MIAKFLYTTFLLGFVFMFASTTQLPRLVYQNFIAPAASQQPATAPANQQQQKIKRAANSEANGQKVNIMPPAQVSTPKPPQSAAQLGFLFAISLLNFFICYKLFRWIYRIFLKTPLYLIGRVFSFLIVKPYKYLFTPQIIARYEFMRPVPTSSTAGSVIVQ